MQDVLRHGEMRQTVAVLSGKGTALEPFEADHVQEVNKVVGGVARRHAAAHFFSWASKPPEPLKKRDVPHLGQETPTESPKGHKWTDVLVCTNTDIAVFETSQIMTTQPSTSGCPLPL